MRLLLLAAFLLTASCSGQNNRVEGAPHIEQLWLTEGFTSPEGVAAAPQGGYFISNIVGDGEEKDGQGWVSLVSADGGIITERFVEGLDAPKGMTVLNGVLYVADIDQVRLFDAESGDAKGAVAIEGALFLNDATVWQDAVFVSDSRTATIHRIADGGASVWLTDDALSGVNGLLGDGDIMLVTTMESGSLISAAKDGSLTEIARGMKDADGVGLVPGGGWLVSCWPGKIFYVATDGRKSELLDTKKQTILQNDLSVFGDTVIVPNWVPGTVTAWRIVE